MARTSEIRTPENVYLIEKESDFPVQDATTITLGTGVYTINAVIVTAKRFIIGDGEVVQMRGTDAFIGGVVYTGTGDMWTFSDILSLSFTETFMTAPLGTIYNVTNATMSAAQVFIINTAIFDSLHFGGIENVTQFTGYFNAFTDIGSGINLDSVDLTLWNECLIRNWKNETTSMFICDGTSSSFGLSNSLLNTGTNESFFDFKSTLTIDGVIVIGNTYDSSAGGALFAAGSKDETDVNISISPNINMPDSITFGNMNMPTSESVTITTLGVPVIVNDVTTGGTNIWTELGNTSRFTFSSTLGRFTYTGLADVNVLILCSSSIQKVGGGSNFIATIIAKNGAMIAESKSGSTSNNPTNVVSIADTSLSTGDYIELAVQNDDGTSNITIDISNFIIKD